MPKTQVRAPETKPEAAQAAARSAGLRWASDTAPGLRRLRVGKAFRYVRPSGAAAAAADAERARKLAIPPAWIDVWISPDARGHLQATGRDAKGRKQYRYHPRWRAVRDETKFGRLLEFGCALPDIRAAVERDLARHGLPREKVLATVLRLLEKTLIRVGNEEYARANRSFGLTTLTGRHVKVSGTHIAFHFRGKSGKEHAFGIRDRELSRIVKRCQDLPGQDLFQYLGADGRRHGVGSGDVNAYLRALSGRDFTAKDFRTWAGTVRAAFALAALPEPASERQAKAAVKEAIAEVAQRLGNTPAVCRKSYVHPVVVDSFGDGSLRRRLKARVRGAEVGRALRGLRPAEAKLLRLLASVKERPSRPETITRN